MAAGDDAAERTLEQRRERGGGGREERRDADDEEEARGENDAMNGNAAHDDADAGAAMDEDVGALLRPLLGPHESEAPGTKQQMMMCGICVRPVPVGACVLLPCCHACCRQCAATEVVAALPLVCPVCGTVAAKVQTTADVAALPSADIDRLLGPEEDGEPGPMPDALASAVRTAAARSADLAARLGALAARAQDADRRTATLTAQVDEAFDALERLVQLRRQALLHDVAVYHADERGILATEIAADRRRWTALQSGLRLAERLGVSSGVDAAGGETGTTSAPGAAGAAQAARAALAGMVAAHLIESATPPVRAMPPEDIPALAIAPDLSPALETAGSLVYPHAYGPACVARGAGLGRATLGYHAAFSVTARTRTDEPVQQGGDRLAVRISLGSGGDDAGDVTMVDLGNGVYNVRYRVAGPASAGTGTLHVEMNGRPVRGSPFAVAVTAPRVFVFSGAPTGNFYDHQGILYHLATAGGTRPWSNPHESGVVVVTMSVYNQFHQALALGLFVANRPPLPTDVFYSDSIASAWIAVSLRGVRVRPTGYVLSADGHAVRGGAQPLRDWQLQGSVDGATWTTLRAHRNDRTLTSTSLTGYWALEDLPPTPTHFGHFRILAPASAAVNLNAPQPRVAAADGFTLATSFEVYGEVLE